MKKFIIEVFGVFFLIGVLMMATFFSSFLIQPYETKAIQYDYVQRHKSEIKILCLGNSLLETGFNSDIIDSSYNLASGRRPIYYDLKLVERLLPSMPNLETVLFPLYFPQIGGAFFSDKKIRRAEISEYVRYMKIMPEIKYLGIIEIAKTIIQGIHYPKKKELKITETGFVPLYTIGNTRPEYPITEDVGELINNLIEMARICKENEVRLVLVTCPVNRTYQKLSVTEQEVEQLFQIAEIVNNHYPIEYHSYLNDPMFCDDSLFYDQVHLNVTGATLLTNRLKHDLHL